MQHYYSWNQAYERQLGWESILGYGVNHGYRTPSLDLLGPRIGLHSKLLVHSFIRCDTIDFYTTLLRDYFHPEDIHIILGLRPSNMWSMDGFAWNHSKLLVHSFIRCYTTLLRDYFHSEDILIILGLRPSNMWSMDAYAWDHAKSRVYSVKSGYSLLHKKNET